MQHRKTIVYNPEIVATKENLKEAEEQFDEALKNAPNQTITLMQTSW